MSDVILYGTPASSFTRTARMACVEKGVPHQLHPVKVGSHEHLELHPFAKMPAMKHGHVHLYETHAIATYIDAVFEGPPLVPSDVMQRARMEQWISVAASYLYPDAIKGIVLQYAFPRGENGQPDRKVIDASFVKLQRDLVVLDKALAGRQWLADQFSLADLFVGAIIGSLSRTPENSAVLACENVRLHVQALGERKAGEFLVPK